MTPAVPLLGVSKRIEYGCSNKNMYTSSDYSQRSPKGRNNPNILQIIVYLARNMNKVLITCYNMDKP